MFLVTGSKEHLRVTSSEGSPVFSEEKGTRTLARSDVLIAVESNFYIYIYTEGVMARQL